MLSVKMYHQISPPRILPAMKTVRVTLDINISAEVVNMDAALSSTAYKHITVTLGIRGATTF